MQSRVHPTRGSTSWQENRAQTPEILRPVNGRAGSIQPAIDAPPARLRARRLVADDHRSAIMGAAVPNLLLLIIFQSKKVRVNVVPV